VLTIERRAAVTVAAPPERCFERLIDIEAYPCWASLIERVERVDDRIRLHAELLGVPFAMDCALEVAADRVVLRRLPYSDDDEERYEATWVVAPDGGATRVELRVAAAVDVPGAARLVRGRIERRLADDLLGDFVRSL
jgi:Polyketide cyclase / dehydrase and lipid transport